MTITYLIGIGSNLPQNDIAGWDLLQSVVAELTEASSRTPRRSRWVQTPAYPAVSGPDFVKGAIEVDSSLPPKDFL